MAETKCVLIYDVRRQEWREIRTELGYVPKCGNSLHQIGSFSAQCMCGEVKRPKPVTEKS
jgi:hypothetical protein